MKKMMPVMLVMMIIVISAIVFVGQGIAMHSQVATDEVAFHKLQSEYFTLSKAERESAATGSALNQKLVDIQNYPSALMELKLVGVGKILTGIFLMLTGILIALIMMPVRLKALMQKQ